MDRPAADAASAPARPCLLVRMAREPLTHFLAIGLALFLVAAVRGKPSAPQDDARRIVLTDDDLRQLTGLWQAQWGRAPTPEELRRLVDDQIREEIYFREALVAGLDKQDILVRRRLVERMAYISATGDDIREPTETELRDWYAAHKSLFTVPRDVTFRLLYFSDRARGGRAKEEAILARDGLAGKPSTAPEASSLGDPSEFAPRHEGLAPDEAAGLFGQTFATALGRLPASSWQGPVEVPGGWSLVFIEEVTPGDAPPYEAVRPEVLEKWREIRREAARQKAYAAMRARYAVTLPASLEGPKP